MKLDKQRQVKPRLEKGPIVVSLDTSGSMTGKPIQLAKCLLLQLLKMAKKQKRKCFLITFSVRANFLDLSRYGAWKQLKKFLDNHFSGGTDGEQMLRTALNMLQTANFSMADVLMQIEHEKGTRFYGLRIDSNSDTYNDILDKIWQVNIRNRNSG